MSGGRVGCERAGRASLLAPREEVGVETTQRRRRRDAGAVLGDAMEAMEIMRSCFMSRARSWSRAR